MGSCQRTWAGSIILPVWLRESLDYGAGRHSCPLATCPNDLDKRLQPERIRGGHAWSSSADPGARGSGSQQTFVQRSDNHFNQLNIANTVLVASQDPAMTSLGEATAQLRHGEHVEEIKSEAERLHGDRLQAVRVQAEQEHEKKVSEAVGILQERMHAEEARMWERAEVTEKTTQRRLRDQSEEYRTVLDSHLRQVTASKDQQMEQMKREYSTQVAKKDVKISELEGLVRTQSAQIAQQQRMAEDLNWKMNQLLMGTSMTPLETGTMTMPCSTKTHSTLSPEAKTFHIQVPNSEFQAGGEAEPWMLNTSGFPLGTATAATIAFAPNLIPPVSPDISTGWSNVTGIITPQEQLPPSPTEPAYTPVWWGRWRWRTYAWIEGCNAWARDNPYPQKKHRRIGISRFDWVAGVIPILGSGTPIADGSGNGTEHLEIRNLILLPCLHCLTITLVKSWNFLGVDRRIYFWLFQLLLISLWMTGKVSSRWFRILWACFCAFVVAFAIILLCCSRLFTRFCIVVHVVHSEAYRSFPGRASTACQGGGYFCMVLFSVHVPCTFIGMYILTSYDHMLSWLKAQEKSARRIVDWLWLVC